MDEVLILKGLILKPQLFKYTDGWFELLETQNVYHSIGNFYKQRGSIPSESTVAEICKKNHLSYDPGFLSEVYRPDTIDTSWLIGETVSWVRDKNRKLAEIETAGLITGGKYTLEKAEEIAKKRTVQIEDPVTFYTVEQLLDLNYAVDSEPHSIGLAGIDEKLLGGGVIKGSLNILAAGTGVGKTVLSTILCCKSQRLGINSAFITVEQPPVQLMKTYIRRALLNRSHHYFDGLSREELREILTQTGVPSILDFKSGSLRPNASTIERELLAIESKTGVPFTNVYIDYLGICKPNKDDIDIINTNHFYGTIALELREMASRNNWALIVPAQMNRDALEKEGEHKKANISQIAKSIDVVQHADTVLYLSTSEIDGIFSVETFKNRYSGKGSITVDVQYDTMDLRLVEEPLDEPITREITHEGAVIKSLL
jgi:hypothetical protein